MQDWHSALETNIPEVKWVAHSFAYQAREGSLEKGREKEMETWGLSHKGKLTLLFTTFRYLQTEGPIHKGEHRPKV